MERNHNEHQVVMSVEMYNNLLGMVNRTQFTTSKIEKHVRKFNPFLQKEHQFNVRQKEKERTANIRLARKLVKELGGKVVYARTFVNLHQEDMLKQGDVYTAMILKRVDPKDRTKVHLYPITNPDFSWRDLEVVSPRIICSDLPSEYVQLPNFAIYRNLAVKIDSPIHKAHLDDVKYYAGQTFETL